MLEFVTYLSKLLGTRPRVVILSGAGVQAIWQVKGCNGEKGRSLLRRFGRLVKTAALKHNVKIDTVFDASRVLRAPLTWNRKYDPPRRTALAIDDTAEALTPGQLHERLRQAGIYECPDDGAADLGEVVSAKETWEYSRTDTFCNYSAAALEAWQTDEPQEGRHSLLLNHLVRLAAMWRYGCIPGEKQLTDALSHTAERHRRLCREGIGGEVRLAGRYEAKAAWIWAVGRVARMTYRQLEKELGVHSHPYPSPAQSRAMARRIDKDLALRGENLRFWIGDGDSATASSFPVQWDGRRYQYLTNDGVKDLMWDIVEHARYEKFGANGQVESVAWPQTPSAVNGLVQAIHGVAKMNAGIKPNSWIDSDTRGLVIPLNNGLFQLSDKTLTGHSPNFFNLSCLPFDFDPVAKCPLWLKTLDQWWPDDAEAVELLQEWFGYLVSGRTDIHKMLFIRGKARSGKGTIQRVLEKLLGEANVGTLTMRNLVGDSARFALQGHLHSSLISFTDVRQIGPHEGAAFVEFILRVTGKDSIPVDIKNKAPWQGKLPARFMAYGNEDLSIPDATGAMASRLLTLQMNQSFLGKERKGLDDDLELELPGIFNWALEGLDRLSRRGWFVQPESGVVVKEDIDDASNPIHRFIGQYIVTDDRYRLPDTLAFAAWERFCHDNGERPGNSRYFRKLLRAAIGTHCPEIEFKYSQIDGGKSKNRPYYLFGISLAGHKVAKRVVNQGRAYERELLITRPEMTVDAETDSQSPGVEVGAGPEGGTEEPHDF